MASYTPPKPHYGGHLGLVGLLAMIGLTGCVAFNEQMVATNTWLPSWAQQTSGKVPVLKPAQAVTEADMKAVYIVRFDADPELNSVGRNFRKAPATSRATFDEWAKDKPELDDMKLIRASFSGELLLGLPDDSDRTPDDVLKTLNGMDNLVYAERDVMAGVGKKDSTE
ncbi:MAG: hypothetical protein AAFR74_02610 [Pseudomonadota bacterium]